MKENYEFRSRVMLPRRTFTVVRLDGKAFHTYTRDLERPFDAALVDDMVATAIFLCQEVQGARLAYTQSDEISLVLSDTATPTTQAWFDGNLQKIVSISASLATAKFNQLRAPRTTRLACFDSRAFVIPDAIEVENYLLWRQQDAIRNSISMAAQAKFSHSELHGINVGQMQEMLWATHGVNWNDYEPRLKRGSTIVPATTHEAVTYIDRRSGLTHTTEATERRTWGVMDPVPGFAQDRPWLAARIAGETLVAVPA